MSNDTPSSDQTATPLRKVLTDPQALWQLSRESVSAWIDDYAPSMGAAISYYTAFSIAPLLLIVIAVAGLVLGQEAASGRIFTQLQGLIGDDGAAAIQGMVKSASSTGKSTIATIVGIATLLFGATTVFAELQSALDRIWRAPAAQKSEGLWTLLRTRLLSFGMILGIGFLLLISLVASAALAAVGGWWAPMFGEWKYLLGLVNFVFSFAVITVLFAMIYKFLPRARIGWHDVWIGAGVTSLLFTIGKFLIGLYIGKSSVVSGFGAAGSFVVVLVWVYYSAQILLLGAEFTWIYAYRFGSRRGQSQEADAAQTGRIPSKSAPPGGASPAGADDGRSDGNRSGVSRHRPRVPAGGIAQGAASLVRRHPVAVGLALVTAAVVAAVVAVVVKGRPGAASALLARFSNIAFDRNPAR